jgi:hypothetical protein
LWLFNDKKMKEQIGKYCLDLSKLVFGGAILSAVMQEGLPSLWIILAGGLVVAILATSGFLLIKNK